MNGVEVIRQVRRVLAVPILIVMMHLSDQVVHDAIEAGANGYVLKKDVGRHLSKAVHTILSRGEFFSDSGRLGSAIRIVEEDAEWSWRSTRLTSHEGKFPRLLAHGLNNQEIASMLHTSAKTAAMHRTRIMAKLELHSITELVRYAGPQPHHRTVDIRSHSLVRVVRMVRKAGYHSTDSFPEVRGVDPTKAPVTVHERSTSAAACGSGRRGPEAQRRVLRRAAS